MTEHVSALSDPHPLFLHDIRLLCAVADVPISLSLSLSATFLSPSQPARKRHKSAQAALSPPPISSLSTPSLNPRTPPHSGPVIVPNEKSLQTTITTGNTRESLLLGATIRPNNSTRGQSSLSRQTVDQETGSSSKISPPSLLSTPLFTGTSSARGSSLASLKFTAPPPPAPPISQSPDHSKHPATPPTTGMDSGLNFSPKFHAANVSCSHVQFDSVVTAEVHFLLSSKKTNSVVYDQFRLYTSVVLYTSDTAHSFPPAVAPGNQWWEDEDVTLEDSLLTSP